MIGAYRELAWVAAGVIAWFAVRMFSPKASGYILAALVVGALVKLGPAIANSQIGKGGV